MINIPPIPTLIITYLFLARLIGFALITLSVVKAISEVIPDNKWLKNFVAKIPVLRFRTDTRKLLLIFTISLWFGSVVPLLQTLCYLIPRCLPYVGVSIIPSTVAIGTNVLLAGVILYIIYYTKEKV